METNFRVFKPSSLELWINMNHESHSKPEYQEASSVLTNEKNMFVAKR